jgi:hypothetical protein
MTHRQGISSIMYDVPIVQQSDMWHVLQVLSRNAGVETGTTTSLRRARPRDGRPATLGAAMRDVRPGRSIVE